MSFSAGSRFRTSVTKSPPKGVDRANNIIHGVKLIDKGPLNDGDSRPWDVDDTTLTQSLDFASRPNKGLKARFTHPNMSSDGLGTHVGRWRNPRIENDSLIADLHVADSSFDTPSGDIGSYILNLAEEDPEAFGVSLATRVAKETLEANPKNGDRVPLRFAGIQAGDFVDTPAATRGGLFSSEGITKDPAYLVTWVLDHCFADSSRAEIESRFGGFLTKYYEGEDDMSQDNLQTATVPEPVVAAPVAAPVVAPVVTAVPAPVTAPADLTVAKKEARDEFTAILALCTQQGCPEKASQFIEQSLSLDTVKDVLLALAVAQNTALSVGGNDSSSDSDVDDDEQRFEKEYAENAEFKKMGISKEEYVKSRKIDEGIEPLR